MNLAQRTAQLLLLCILIIPAACLPDEDPGPGGDNGDTIIPDNDDDDTGEIGTFTLLDQSPNLPNQAFNYANINLPQHFNNGQVNNQDNTPAGNTVTNAGATLGRVLFYDKQLSANNTIACASCHKQDQGFSDNTAFSTGFEGGLTGRNSMGLTNARFYQNGHFFWDERAETLEDQTLMPIQDGTEMGMDLPTLVAKLSATDYYGPLFQDAFGSTEVTSDRIALAISQFIRAMVSYQTDFDAGIQAIGNQDFEDTPFPNYSPLENLGKQLFFSNRTNCSSCHGSINLVPNTPRNNGLDLVYADNGIGDVSGNPQDNGLFKINSLRNVALTSPYMHDGRFNTLEEVVEHYNSGVQAHPNLSNQLRQGGPGGPGGNNGGPRRLNLTENEKDGIVAFLETLTDEPLIADVKFSDPF